MSISCPQCAAQMPDTAAFCPGCGRPMQESVKAQGKVGILPERVAGPLAYLTFIPAVVFLFLPPYSRNRFLRFHSFQCILFTVALLLLAIALRLLGLVLLIIPVVGYLLLWLIVMVVFIAAAIVWVVLVVKALQGEAFELPWIGEYAQRKAALY